MRIALLGAALLICSTPYVSSAQAWKEWQKSNPTYPTQQPNDTPKASTPASTPAPRSSVPASTSQQPSDLKLAEAEFRRGFMMGCLKKAPRSYCDCAVNHLLSNNQLETIMQELKIALNDSKMPPSVAAAMNACLS